MLHAVERESQVIIDRRPNVGTKLRLRPPTLHDVTNNAEDDMTTTANDTGIPTQLGHVALRVHDVDRSVEWYTEVLGLKLKNRMRGVAFLGIRQDASHEVALFPLPHEAEGPYQKRVGLYHFAWEMPSF